ncbi:META domain-containing protein [Stappia sediminis]|nr:META domain-containing protein [Stappia sediminis]
MAVGAPEITSGKWLAEDLKGGGVVDIAQTYFEIGADGRISGSGGCNRMTGQAEIDGDQIKIGPLASTRMACPDALMNQEQTFFQVLEEAVAFRIDTDQNKLFLIGAKGEIIARFSLMD